MICSDYVSSQNVYAEILTSKAIALGGGVVQKCLDNSSCFFISALTKVSPGSHLPHFPPLESTIKRNFYSQETECHWTLICLAPR